MKIKNDKRTRYTKQFIREALIELLQEKNVKDITVIELCKKAEISRSTFYLHYSDCYDVLHSLQEEFYIETAQTLDDCGGKTMADYEIHLARFFALIRDSGYGRIFFITNKDASFCDRLTRLSFDRFHELFSEGFAASEDADLFARFVCGAVSACLVGWIEGGYRENPNKYTAAISGFINYGIGVKNVPAT